MVYLKDTLEGKKLTISELTAPGPVTYGTYWFLFFQIQGDTQL